MTAQGSITLIGGTGFVGSHLAHRLTELGYRVLVPTRRRERAKALAVNPAISVQETDLYAEGTLDRLLSGQDAVINLVGILNESGFDGSGFQRAHVELTEKVLAACQRHGVPRLLHMSALNANAQTERGHYLRTKGEAEDLVHAAGDQLRVTSFRPSVIFGPGDSFFNRFATLLKLTPGLFPLACAQARFAPVYVLDVVEAFTRALDREDTAGKRYDLCGPKAYSLQGLVEYTARVLELKRLVVPLPDLGARMQARVLERMPGKPFTMDNYWSLQIDSVCDHNGLADLGIEPRSLESIVPQYLGRRQIQARYSEYRKYAQRP